MSVSARYQRSYEMFEQAKKIVPGGVQASRRPWLEGRCPVYVGRAEGCRCWDVDGNEYIDYSLSLGPIILGYCDPRVDEAAIRQIRQGTVFTFNHPLQNRLAEKLIEHIPSAEMATFLKTGSEATSAAVRVARAYTGRERVARCGYHGWHDWCNVGAKGVPAVLQDQTIAFNGNHPENLEQVLSSYPGEFAAVILAPEEISPPEPEKFQRLLEIAEKHEAVFILDEVKTGFRMGLGGIQRRMGIRPHLTTLSKAMANGYPIGALVGQREVMQAADEVHISATFNGEVFSMAASLATIAALEQPGVLEGIWEMGERLIDGLNELASRHAVKARAFAMPLPPMPFMRFEGEGEAVDRLREEFYAEMYAQGILLSWGHVWFVCAAHGPEEIDRTLECADAAFERAKQRVA